jgi:tetratricopeptide (TPR) repeat protein
MAAAVLGACLLTGCASLRERAAEKRREANEAEKRGDAARKNKDYDLAIAEYSEAIRLNPASGDFYFGRAYCYNKKGEFDLAIADYTKAIKIDPDRSALYNNRGNAYDEKGEWDLAMADYTKAIEINPKYAYAYNNRGLAYAQKGETERAAADYREAIRIDPKYRTAKNNLDKIIIPAAAQDAYWRGVEAFYNKDYDRAIAEHTEAIKLYPNYVRAYNERGRAYLVKADYVHAIDDFGKARKLDPVEIWHVNNLGLAHIKRGDYFLAQNNFSYARLEYMVHASAAYTDALKIDPNDTTAKNGLAAVKKGSADVANKEGDDYKNKGDYAEAITSYRSALFHYPQHQAAKKSFKEVWDKRMAGISYPSPYQGNWKYVVRAAYTKEVQVKVRGDEQYSYTWTESGSSTTGRDWTRLNKSTGYRPTYRTETLRVNIPESYLRYEFRGKTYTFTSFDPEKSDEAMFMPEEATSTSTGTFYYDGDAIELDDGTVLRFKDTYLAKGSLYFIKQE